MTLCKCGCGQEIVIKKHHKWYGNSEYVLGHNKSQLGKHHSKETKRKISESQIGKHLSEEHKKKISKSKSGEKHPLYGKRHSEEFKKKMSKTHMGKHLSEESKKKMSESKSGENHPNWQGGSSFEPYCEKFNEIKREEIRNQYDRKCYICGKHENDNITKTNKIRKLSVHHIDMDKEQGCNGKQWKLVSLCMNCHGSKKMKILEI